jgi:hypothetical protein
MIARGKRVSAPPLVRRGEKNPTPEGSHFKLECATPLGSECFYV